MNYSEYIYPIIGPDIFGNGVLAGSLFITSGHVAKKCRETLHILVDGKLIQLPSPLICRYEEEETGFDLAVYKMDGYVSPIILSDEMPKLGTSLESISWKEVRKARQAHSASIFDSAYSTPEGDREAPEITICNVEVTDIIGNYFTGLSSINLKGGCSGSPVFLNGKIAGIIAAGNNNGDDTCVRNDMPLNHCVFLSSQAISQLIKSCI